MIFNEGVYTAPTWLQLLICLIVVALIAVLVISGVARMRRKRQAGRAGAQIQTRKRGPEPTLRKARRHINRPTTVVSIMRAAYYTLGVLAASRKPVFLGSIVRRVHAAQKAHRDKDLLTPVTIRTSLDRLISHGNVRLQKHGISITDSGRALFTRVARINEKPVPEPGQLTLSAFK